MIDQSFDMPNNKRLIPEHKTNVKKLIGSLAFFEEDGSFVGDIPVIKESRKANAGSKFEAHRNYLRKLKDVAVLYGYNTYYPGSIAIDHASREEYKELVYNSLKWYFANRKPPTGVYRETFDYQSYNETIVGLLTYIGMLVYDDIHEDRKSDASIQSLYENIVAYCSHVVTDNPQSRGPNWAYRYGNCLRHVIFSNDPIEMDKYAATNNASLDFDVWGENGTNGIWPDWTLTHHGDEGYWGMYGTSWMTNTLELAALLKGTAWEYTNRQIQFIETSAVEGLQWVLYKGNTEMTSAPKRLTYFLERTDRNASLVIENLEMLVDIHRDKLADPNQIEYLIRNIDPSWEESNNNNIYDEVTGHKYFWNTEYQVHRRSNYSIAVRRTSQRVRGPEDSANSDIKAHLHFGSGFTSILRRGDEYRLSRLGFDYQTLPGTTTELNGIVNAGKASSGKRGAGLFSGGTSDGEYGVGAFEMRLGEYQYETNSWNLINGAGALKGNFFFEKEMVCLGQEVNRINAGANVIWTTLNQLQRRGDIVYALDDQEPVTIGLDDEMDKSLRIDQKAWFWHDEIGYMITTKKMMFVKLMAERRTLNPVLMQDSYYRDALSAFDRNQGTINMFQLVINHGQDPIDDSYAYKVVPDISLGEFNDYVSPSTILINKEKVQAVYTPAQEDSILQVVFYEAGSFSYDKNKTITVDKPTILMMRQSNGTLSVSVSNPLHRGLTPSFVMSESPTIGEAYNEPLIVSMERFGIIGEEEGVYQLAFDFPNERGYEGSSSQKTVNLKTDGGLSEAIVSDVSEEEGLGETTVSEEEGLGETTVSEEEESKEVLGINSFSGLKVFPNPFEDGFNVESIDQINEYRIYSIPGGLIKSSPISSGNQFEVSTSELSAGNYLLELIGEDGARTKSIIKVN